MKTHSSWGRFPQSNPAQIVPLDRLSELPNLGELPRQVLAYGLGRSYGDCCLNDGGILLDTLGLDRFLHMDQQSGKLRSGFHFAAGRSRRVVLVGEPGNEVCDRGRCRCQ
jgi:hypothetical protein